MNVPPTMQETTPSSPHGSNRRDSEIHRMAASIKRRVLSTSDEFNLQDDDTIQDQFKPQHKSAFLFFQQRIQDLWTIFYLSIRLYKYVWFGIRWWFKFIRLILFTLLLLPGFSQMILFYFFSPRLLRSVPYGSKPRNMLDIYLPRSKWRRLGPCPVVIYVTGGAWTIGYKAWGALFGRRLSQRGVLVFCLDYRNFPQGNALDMLVDINTGIKWVLTHCSEYGGDGDSVWLVGQSAGGHLTSMSLLLQALRSFECAMPLDVEDDCDQHSDCQNSNDTTTSINNTNNNTNKNTTNTTNTNTNTNTNNNSDTNHTVVLLKKNTINTPEWNLHHLKGYVAVSGAFNLLTLAEHLHRRGLYKNMLGSIMSDSNGNPILKELSPTYIVSTLPRDIALLLPKTVLLHGTADRSVPIENAEEFARAMSNAGVTCELKQYKGKTHTQPIVEDPMRGGRDALMDEILGLVKGEACYNEQFAMLPSFLIDFATLMCPF